MKKILSFVIVIILLSACNKVKEEPLKSENKINRAESFEDFFNKFSTNSKFRVSRIKFPIDGFNSDETNTNAKDKPYKWEKEDWLFYAAEDFTENTSGDVKKTEIIKTNSFVTYRIFKEDSGYDIQYRFKVDKDKWYLVNYSYKNF
ncbi:MAG: hypothetical protein RIQ59_2154 [Bacteroidota bacterium]|jgi:Domain of unknown function (DUF4348)